MNRRRFTVLALLVGALSATGPVRQAKASELQDKLDDVRASHGIAAAAYLTVSAETVLEIEALGYRTTASNVGFTVDDLIRIGSITKTMTALATMILVEHGVLQLSAPVTSIVAPPPYENPWEKTHPVRLDQLLEHTAGLADMSAREFGFNEPVSVEDAFDVDPASRRLPWPSGMHASYSNSGAGILSYAIERRTGQPFESIVAGEVFAPLGMRSATFHLSALERQRLIPGYDTDGRTPIPYWHTLYRAFGGVSVATRDMAPLIRLFLNRGRHQGHAFLTPAAIRRIETPRTSLAARSGLEYGYGLGVYAYQRRGVSFYGHGGDADGYLAFFAYSRELDRGYFVVINAFNNTALREMRHLIEDSFIGEYRAEAAPVYALTNTHRQRLLGEYLRATHRFRSSAEPARLTVIELGDDLATVSAEGKTRALIAVSPWHFRRRDETIATIAFIVCGDRLFLQGDFGNYEKLSGSETDAPRCDPSTIEPAVTRTPYSAHRSHPYRNSHPDFLRDIADGSPRQSKTRAIP